MSLERVAFVGGPLDGAVAAIGREASLEGFAVYTQPQGDDPGDDILFGYFDRGCRNAAGLRIFGLGQEDAHG